MDKLKDAFSLKEWLMLNNVQCSSQVTEGDFETFITHLSINARLSYHKLCCYLFALRNVEGQKKLIDNYQNIYGLGFSQDDKVIEPQWSLANITLCIENDAQYDAAIGLGSYLSNGEKYAATILHKYDFIPFTHEDYDRLTQFDPDVLNHRMQHLISVAQANRAVGAYKAASIFYCIARRINQLFDMPAVEELPYLAEWVIVLFLMGKWEAVFRLLEQTLPLLDDVEVTNIDQALAFSFYLVTLTEMMIRSQLLEEAPHFLFLADNALAGIPDDGKENGIYKLVCGLKAKQYAALAVLQGQLQQSVDLCEESVRWLSEAAEADPELGLMELSSAKLDFLLLMSQHDGNNQDALLQIMQLDDTLKKIEPVFRRDYYYILSKLHYVKAVYEGRNVDVVEAKRALLKASHYLELYPYKDTDDCHILLVQINMLLVRTHHNVLEYQDALKVANLTLEYAEKHLELNNAFGKVTLASLLNSKGFASLMLGKFVQALQACETAKKLLLEISGSGAPEVDTMTIELHLVMAKCYLKLKRHQEAMECVEIVKAFLAQPAYEVKREYDIQRGQIHFMAFDFAQEGLVGKNDLAQSSRSLAQLVDITQRFTAQYHNVLGIFYLFHFRWLAYAANYSTGDIPLALSAIHGRSLARRYEDLSESNMPDHSAHAVIASRQRLSDHTLKAESLKEQIHDLVRRICMNADVAEDSHIQTFKKLAALEDEHKEAAKRHLALHRETDATGLAYQPFIAFSAEKLKERLSENECLLFLIDIDAPKVGETEAVQLQGAWLLLANGRDQYIPLDMNLDVVTDIRDYSPRAFIVDDADENNFWTTAKDNGRKKLWDCIVSELPTGIETLSIVTMGRFHLLPFDLGLPYPYTIKHYLSLLFFCIDQQSQGVNASYCSLVNETCDLPFAKTEGAGLLSNIWSYTSDDASNIEVLVDPDALGKTDVLKFLHIAGHGFYENNKSHFSIQGKLQFSEKQGLIDEAVILNDFPQAEIVWLSACNLGMSLDDMHGDPSGMVIPFLFRGCRYVVASLIEIHDAWAPLLLALTEWAHSHARQPFLTAFQLAKQSLTTWVDRAEFQLLVPRYRNWLRDVWFDLLEELWVDETLGITSFEHGSPDDMPEFCEQVCWVTVPSMGVSLDSSIVDSLTMANNITVLGHVGRLVDAIVDASLTPPPSIVDDLVYGTKIFACGR